MKKTLYFFFLFAILLIITSNIKARKVSNHLLNSKILIKEEIIFTLKAGTGKYALSRQLYNKKIINYMQIFQLHLYSEPEFFKFKAGTYRFTPDMSMHEIFQLLKSGKEAQFSLCFVEGMRLSNYLELLRKAPYIQHTLKDDNYATVAKALNIIEPDQIEGWFWPDTWSYTANTTDVALLKRAHKKMVSVVENTWKNRADNLPYKDQNQFVTMASIVEKETAITHERNKIASVFINRLRIGMRLQTDPTVIYGMNTAQYNCKISKRDLEMPTAYNTYIIRGLPPGPIATPSQTSLHAAAHPAKTSYLYFVADGKGGHIFNKNLASHNQSVKKYIHIIKRKNAQ